MKKLTIIILTLSLVLVGCSETEPPDTQPSTVVTTAPTEPTGVTNGTEVQAPSTDAATQPTQPAILPTEPVETKPPMTEPPVTEPPVTEAPATEPPVTEPIPTEPPVTKPEDTTPPETEPEPPQPIPTEPMPTEPIPTEPVPTEPKPTEPTPTESEKEPIDIAAIEEYARSYAESLGFVIDTSLKKGNSGYYPPDYRPLFATEEGFGPAEDLVCATKDQLNSRFTSEFCETLMDDIYGLVRMNCLVEYSHTDILGDWFYIYIFYG